MDLKIVEEGLIASEKDLLKLDIVDWNRLNGYWANTSDALHTLASWFVGNAKYTIIESDLRQAPPRGDFPGWDHVGGHESIGMLYWNWFHAYHVGSLVFSDSPDFYGTIEWPNEEVHRFYGDIGKASPSALTHTQKHMQAGDLWVSVVSRKRQVVIEPLVDLYKFFGNYDEYEKRVSLRKECTTQLSLF